MRNCNVVWTANPLLLKECLQRKQRKYVKIGALVMDTVSGATNADSCTLVHKVVVKGSKVQEEKDLAKAKAEAKEKAKEKGKPGD